MGFFYALPTLEPALIVLLSLPPAIHLTVRRKALWGIVPTAINTLIVFTCMNPETESNLRSIIALTTCVVSSAIAGLGTYHGAKKFIDKRTSQKAWQALPIILFFPTLLFYILAWGSLYIQIGDSKREPETCPHTYNGLPCW